MSKLLETLGAGLNINPIELIANNPQAISRLSDEKSSSLEEILTLVQNRQLDSGTKQLRLYLFENPDCAAGRLIAAAICISKNQLEEAITELTSVHMRQPNNIYANYFLAHCYERLGREAEAVEFYQDCAKVRNDFILPQQRLAAIYFKNGRTSEAIEQYYVLTERNQDDHIALTLLGYLYMADHKFTEAIDTFFRAIQVHPDNIISEENEIRQLINNGELYDALEEVEALPETNLSSIIQRADILRHLDRLDEAIPLYQEAIDICPDFLEAAIKLGIAYLRRYQNIEAAKQFINAVEINDQIVDAYFGLAQAQKLNENIFDSCSTLGLAAANQPNSYLLFAEAVSLSHKCLLNTEDSMDVFDVTGEIIQEYREKTQKHYSDPYTHYRLGMLLSSIGNYSEAADLFNKSLEIEPTFYRARTKLCLTMYEMGYRKQALHEIINNIIPSQEIVDHHYKTAFFFLNTPNSNDRLKLLQAKMESDFENNFSVPKICIALENTGLLNRSMSCYYLTEIL